MWSFKTYLAISVRVIYSDPYHYLPVGLNKCILPPFIMTISAKTTKARPSSFTMYIWGRRWWRNSHCLQTAASVHQRNPMSFNVLCLCYTQEASTDCIRAHCTCFWLIFDESCKMRIWNHVCPSTSSINLCMSAYICAVIDLRPAFIEPRSKSVDAIWLGKITVPHGLA